MAWYFWAGIFILVAYCIFGLIIGQGLYKERLLYGQSEIPPGKWKLLMMASTRGLFWLPLFIKALMSSNPWED